MLIIGYFSRVAGLVMAFTMIMAIYLAHSSDLLALTKHGGLVIELPLMFLFSGVAIYLLGPGRFAVNNR